MNIDKLCTLINIGKVKNISKITGGLMHKMFKVETDKGIYCIKVLNPEVMNRRDAYNNFIISESISNLAKDNNIPVSSALKINNDFIIKLEDTYYMIFNYIDGKVLKDSEITIDHCKQIGNILSKIHSLDYKKLDLDTEIKEDKFYVEWDKYISNNNFNKMEYKELYLANYKKYYSILKRVVERFNDSNNILAICHRDMDPKNVMWSNNNPIIIDWESASLANPYRELLEVALSWSGFLSNNFNKNKFISVIKEYSKYRNINDIDWYSIICGNLIGRFGWLDYNLKRSLGIKSDDTEEIALASKEVIKTIDEINRYLHLIDTMYKIFNDINNEDNNNYDNYIKDIINNNEILKDKEYKVLTSGFTNTIYQVGNYIVRICNNKNNEDRFKKEIDFYNNNKDNNNMPRIYVGDISKEVIPYYYEVIEKIEGNTLYDVWYKLNKEERENIIIKLINVLKTIHCKEANEYDFNLYIKKQISTLIEECNLDNEFIELLAKCDIYFKDNNFGLIHGDLHLDNIICNANEIKLLDFERVECAPIDYDFKLLSTYSNVPWLWASTSVDMLTIEDDYKDLMDMIINNYDALKDIPYIHERLEIYSIIELLNNYKNTKCVDRLEEVKKKIRRLNR